MSTTDSSMKKEENLLIRQEFHGTEGLVLQREAKVQIILWIYWPVVPLGKQHLECAWQCLSSLCSAWTPGSLQIPVCSLIQLHPLNLNFWHSSPQSSPLPQNICKITMPLNLLLKVTYRLIYLTNLSAWIWCWPSLSLQLVNLPYYVIKHLYLLCLLIWVSSGPGTFFVLISNPPL